MIKNLVSFFPEKYTPSGQQQTLLEKIDKAFEENKFVICNAPTGSGKSFLSKTLGNYSTECSLEFKELITSYDAFKQTYDGSYEYEPDCLLEDPFGSFVLTITKSLQDQYQKLFQEDATLKGKTNYTCQVDDQFDVDTAPCLLTPKLKETCWQKNICPYYNARNNLLISKFGILNYKMFLSLPGHVKRKQFIICDEASELEDTLVSQFSVSIDPEKLKIAGVKVQPLINHTDYSQVEKWLSNVCITVCEEADLLLANLLSKKNDKNTQSDKIKLNYLRSIHGSVKMILDTWSECEYVVQKEDKIVKLTPLKVDTLSKHIFKYADKVLLMSATIIDHKTFAKTLGITDYKYVEVDSTFDPAKAPIFINTKLKLNHNNLKDNLPTIAKQIQAICDKHKNDKGIIHTHSMAITSYLQSSIKGKRFLFRSEGQKNEVLLTQHAESTEPTVVVSPSVAFGVDFKDDLARFQIIVKAAFPPLGDARIKKLFEMDKQWYTNKMLCNFVQACGRGVRSKDDHCITYVLDACIYDAIIKNNRNLPKYFLNRFV